MANPYRELFSIPGTRAFVATGFLGRMSMSMLGLGIVLMVSAVTGSYGIAGAVSATSSIAYAMASPIVGRLTDRLGQARVLPPLVLANTLSITTLILCGVLAAPSWAFFPAALATGLTSPSLGALVRARWSHLLAGSARLHTAFSFESVADEVVFVTGPMLVTALSTGVRPWAGLVAGGCFTLVGCLLFAAQRSTQPPPRKPEPGQGGAAIRIPAVVMLAGVFLFMGSAFGAIDVSAVGFAQEQGHKALAGVLLGCYALGSASGGLWYGARRWSAPLAKRFQVSLALLVTGLVPFTLISSFYLMMVVIFFSGLAISPTLISGFGLVEQIVPGHQLTEGLTWISTSVGIGVAVGATAAGRLVDAYGSGGAFYFPLCAGVTAVLVGLAGASRFHKSKEHEFLS